MAFHSCQAIQGSTKKSPHSATPSPLHTPTPCLILTSVQPDSVQSCQMTIKARARAPSQQDTIFQLVRSIYNHGNLGSLKKVAPLRLSPCGGAPSFDIAHLCRSVWSIQSVWFIWLVSFNQTDEIDRIDQTDRACATTVFPLPNSSASPALTRSESVEGAEVHSCRSRAIGTGRKCSSSSNV